MSDTSPELPPVLLGPESGRNVAEHISQEIWHLHTSGHGWACKVACGAVTGTATMNHAKVNCPECRKHLSPDLRDEAVGLLREAAADYHDNGIGFAACDCSSCALAVRIQSFLARIDK